MYRLIRGDGDEAAAELSERSRDMGRGCHGNGRLCIQRPQRGWPRQLQSGC